MITGKKILRDDHEARIVKWDDEIIFEKYSGTDKEYSIPSNVTIVGGAAFQDNATIEKVIVPEGVVSMGDAFKNCKRLHTIILPASLAIIGKGCFQNCQRLNTILIPENSQLSNIDRDVFNDTLWFRQQQDQFVYLGNVLITYAGIADELTELIVKPGTRTVARDAFKGFSSLTRIDLPDSIQYILDSAFEGCTGLKELCLPGTIMNIKRRAFHRCHNLDKIDIQGRLENLDYGLTNEEVFTGCRKLKYIRCHKNTIREVKEITTVNTVIVAEDGVFVSACNRLGSTDGFVEYSWNCDDYGKRSFWSNYDQELINDGPRYHYSLSTRLAGAMGRLLKPRDLNEENKQGYLELLGNNLNKAIAVAEELECPELIRVLFDEGIIHQENWKKIKAILKKSSIPAIVQMIDLPVSENKDKSPDTSTGKDAESADVALDSLYHQKYEDIQGDVILKSIKFPDRIISQLKAKTGGRAPASVLKYILADYGKQFKEGMPTVSEKADSAAELLDLDSLRTVLQQISGGDYYKYPVLISALCRFGSDEQIAEAYIHCFEANDKWINLGKKGDTIGRYFCKALALSKAFPCSKNGLDTVAEMNGIDRNEVFSQIIYNNSFDEQGNIKFDYPDRVQFIGTINEKCGLSLRDAITGREIKQLPDKRTTDVRKQITLLKYDSVKTALVWEWDYLTKTLIPFFIQGKNWNLDEWESVFLRNMFYRVFACLFVWQQGKEYFSLTKEGFYLVNGEPYSLSNEPIILAHPMEMDPEELEKWRNLFLEKEIVQPFSQIWAPVYTREEIKPDRYKEFAFGKDSLTCCYIDLGIITDPNLVIPGYKLQSRTINMGLYSTGIRITLIQPEKWDRYSHTIINYLDSLVLFSFVNDKNNARLPEYLGKLSAPELVALKDIAHEKRAQKMVSCIQKYLNQKYPDQRMQKRKIEEYWQKNEGGFQTNKPYEGALLG